MRPILFAALVALLAACATETPYQPAGTGGDRYGFEEQQIEANRVRIIFRGNALTDRETVENYLLYRAAEVTLQHGKDYFVIADRQTEPHSHLQAVGPTHYPFEYWYFRPRRGWVPAPWYDPFWDEPQSYREITRYEAVAEIAMYNGSKPASDPNAFDAREVQRNLQGRIVRPPPQGS